MNHMNYNWPNRGVQQPYPPSAPTSNASSNPQTAFPYYQQQQPTASSYTTANTYTSPAGYNHAATSYNSGAPTYTNSSAYGHSSHQTGVNTYPPAAASTHSNYSPAVSQRNQQNNAPAVETHQTRPTVTPGTPLSTSQTGSTFSRNSLLATPNQQQNQQAQQQQQQQVQAQAQAQAQAQQAQQARQARERAREQQQERDQAQAQAAQAAAQAQAAAAATQAREERQRRAREERDQQQREQQLQRDQQLRDEQLREAQVQAHEPSPKPPVQRQVSSSRVQEPAGIPSNDSKSTPNATFTQLPAGATAAPKRKSMGRLGDADVHSAFVEFRAKESDKCMSAQCIHCGSVRAKNTSRQRQHLMECQRYLDSMRTDHPNHPILEMAAQHAAGTPLKDIVKPGTNGATPVNGAANGLPYGAPNGHATTPTQANKRVKTDHPNEQVVIQTGVLGSGWAGGSLAPTHTLPPPRLERDFQLAIQLNPRIDVGKNNFGAQTYWTSFISGHWNGRWGKGTVVPGGQDKQHVSNGSGSNGAGAVRTETNFLLQTHDHPTAFITVKMEGWRTGSREIMEQLMDPSRVDSVDPRSYTHRCFVTMETGDERYSDVNTGMWLGTVVRKGTEVVYDAYRIS